MAEWQILEQLIIENERNLICEGQISGFVIGLFWLLCVN